MASRYKVVLYEEMHSRGTDLLRQHCDVSYAKSFRGDDILTQVGGTPHMSAHSEEAKIRMSLAAQDVPAVLEGR